MRVKGERVFDLPSKTETTIVEVVHDRVEGPLYRVDDNVPLDPTGDGAFPTRWRHQGEVCAPSRAAVRLRTFAY
jgi:hypothetical protein